MGSNKKSSKGISIFIFILVMLALICCGLIVAKKFFFGGSVKNSDVTYTVRSETYENVIEISGVVSAAQKQSLQALSSGTVMEVFVKQGDVVKKGDVILQMDDSTEKYNLAKHDYDMMGTKITGSKKAYALMETQREALLQKISERKVTATFDGIIAALSVAAGDSLEAKDSIGTLVDVSYLMADVEVAETDVSKLKEGQPVEFTFAACPETVMGYVVGWPAIGEVTSRGATVVKAKVRIDEYPESILPNFSFSGKIKISPDETYLLVERYAIGRENKKAFVELAQTGQRIPVSVEPYASEYVKIVSGLSGGEVLKAQSEPLASGWNRNRSGRNGKSSKSESGPGRGGAGGPPPRM
ncbi:MAG: HlyD family efflux transporter periplasmic adaptor subunit [Treponema sp.]|nr:HlyD family efflux transporter periplasmic adaptor subunit [Treponema sp.]